MSLLPRCARMWAARFAFVAVAFLAGCSPADKPADLTMINGPDPETLDPALATGIEDLRVITGLFEGLTRNDPKTGEAIPGLAERWEISADGRTYTFHVRSNLWWAKDHPITADDVVFSWLRALSPATASEYAGQLFYLKNGQEYNSGKLTNTDLVGVHALDTHTVQVELIQPTAFFLDLCTFQTLDVVPRYWIETQGETWLKDSHSPTSGPYLLDFWRLNDRIRTIKNPFYWDAVNTRSETQDFLCVSVASTALNLYETGQADIIWDRDYLPPELMDILRQRPDFHSFSYLGTYFLRCNCTKAPFTDSRVRRALALAIDKQRLVDRILRGGEAIADHLVPDGTAHATPAKGLGYDVAEAKRLLAEAGFPEGKGFPSAVFLYEAASGAIDQKIGVELQQMWQSTLGIHFELKQMEKRVYLAAQNHLDYDVTSGKWIGDYDDPNTFLDLFRSDNGNNRTGWKNTRYDSLMTEANQQTDLAKRAALLKKVESILVHDELPIIPLYFQTGLNFYDGNKVKGVYTNILDLHPLNTIFKVVSKH